MVEILSGEVNSLGPILGAGSADNVYESIIRDAAVGLRVVGKVVAGGERNVLKYGR